MGDHYTLEMMLRRARNQIRTSPTSTGFVPLRQILDQYMEERNAITGAMVRNAAPVMSGFDDIDELLGGLHRSELVILAAHSNLGKSSLALNIAVNAARSGAKVGIFSLEMGREQIALRMMSSEAEVDVHRLRLGLLTEAQEHRINDCIGYLSDLQIFVDDTPFHSIMEMRGKSRRLSVERGLDLLIVDCLQLIHGPYWADNEGLDMDEVSRNFKLMARELNVPILAVSRLEPPHGERSRHRPQLSDLDRQGAIEQYADVIALIHRDDLYYNEEEWEQHYPDQIYPQNVTELIVKHRHGRTGTIKLLFEGSLVRFRSAETEPGVFA